MATNYDERTPLLVDEKIEDLNDRLWDRIFEEKCNISLHPEVILYIQNHVESLVCKVVGTFLECEKYRNFITTQDDDTAIAFSEQFNEHNFLKVGSFYEGTKNAYPDEFDYIYVLAESKFKNKKLTRKLTAELSDLFHEQIQEMFADPNFEYGFDFARCSMKGLHGPASKLRLEFNEHSAIGNKIVSVDVSTASRLFLENRLPSDLKVCNDEWKEKILDTGNILVLKVYQTDHPKNKTDVKFTITETEQLYVKSNEFEKHRKLYRLLKYIFNGSDANEYIREIIRRQDNRRTLFSRVFVLKQNGPKVVYDIPSYTIKTLVFHHIQNCQNTDNTTTNCLQAILDSLLALFKANLDRHSASLQKYGGILNFTVSTKSMLGQPLEIADDYVSAAIIEKNLSKLITTVKNARDDEGVAQGDLENCIPFAEQNIETVTDVVDSMQRKRPWPKPIIALIVIYLVILFGTIAGYPIVNYLANNACDTNSNTTSNQTTGIKYCCIGKDNTNNISMIIRSNDVPCMMNGGIRGHIGANNMTKGIDTTTKQATENMNITEATRKYQIVADIRNCIENNTEIVETRFDICCAESDNGTNLPSDDCFYYTNVRNITTTTLRLFHVFLFILPLTLLTRKYIRSLINYVKVIRQHITSDAHRETMTSDANCSSIQVHPGTTNRERLP